MAAFRNNRETFDNMPDNGKLVHALDARFFAPLRRRANTLVSPAREQLERLASGESLESIATDYGTLNSGDDTHA